jgi:outer membrane receptor for ferrienterochelin and colicins
MKAHISFAASIIIAGSLHATESLAAISVESLSDTIEKQGKVKDIVEKTEVITKKQMDKQQAVTLIEAIEKSPGVDVTTNCSMCGIKRVMLNGMRGEHTTVLADGVPFHSTVSSYYGMDALGTGDVESIEIARGSGASLTAPEAIGGTLNIVSRRAKKNGMEFDFAAGEQGYRVGSFVGEGITGDGKTGVIVSGMYSNYDQYDRDNNGVNEAPNLENKIMSVKVTHELTSKDLIDVKVGHSKSDVFGGPMMSESDVYALWGASGTANPSFVGGDVRNRYDGDPMGTMEAIKTTRDEAIFKWTHVGNVATLQTTLAYADAKQESMYEGLDYNNGDKTYFADVKISQALNDAHFLTYGVDFKREKMEAQSQEAFVNLSLPKDDFEYNSYALYLQDTWTINDKTELNLALRAAKITTNFKGQTAKADEIDETIFAPRLHLRYNHNDYITSRFSAGMGYRSPLTFFESEHGLLESGFEVDIDKLEKSNNVSYSLSYDKGPLSVTAGGAYTELKNMAYIDDSITPTLRNYENKVAVKNGDIVVGYALTPSITVSAGYEQYWYDTEYKNLLFIAAVEKQARLMFDYEENGWDAMIQATWTGARDLTDYGYGDRYNTFDGTDVSNLKSTKAPAFTTVDVKVSKEITDTFTLYAGVKNLFDYVQTDKESPLMYDADGGYDVGHIWGPLRGRMAYAGIKAKF